MAETRKRNWAFIIYPEGNPPAPEDWKEQLQAQLVASYGGDFALKKGGCPLEVTEKK